MVRGNHEQNFIAQVRSERIIQPYFKKLKDQMGEDLWTWISWLEDLPLYIEEEDFLVVHAGLEPGKHPSESEDRLLMNIRCWDGKGDNLKDDGLLPPWYSFYKEKKLVIYGHWANQGLLVRKNTVGLDSGCVYGKNLSGIWLPSREILQVKASKVYYMSS